jgi:hypothetical protein
MIAHIFDPVAKFAAVRYNTDKVESGKGELMKVANFGAYQALDNLRPEDYRNYLEMISARGKQVKLPQFHAVISAKGKAYDKYTLTGIAEAWLDSMGYARQPYLIIFHKDTGNNHVHMVTTRVGRDGVKIDSDYEHVKGVQRLNKIMGLDEGYTAQQDIEKALSYAFSTKAQFVMILESQGYVLKENGGIMDVIKFGHKLAEVKIAVINEKIAGHQQSAERIRQLRAIFEKYRRQKDATLQIKTIPLPGGLLKSTGTYSSELAGYLKEKMGITLLFHAKEDKPPYGYTIIDHAGKAVFKGSEVMPLKELISFIPLDLKDKKKGKDQSGDENESKHPETAEISQEQKDYYSALLKAALRNYPDLAQGLHHQGLRIENSGGSYRLTDDSGTAIPIDEILAESDRHYFIEEYSQMSEISAELHRQLEYIPPVSIADDIDDEQINGRNRRRKRKARTNTR